MTNLFDLPFHEYMARRTKYAVDTMQRTNLVTVDGALVALMQAGWAREYWFNKVQGEQA